MKDYTVNPNATDRQIVGRINIQNISRLLRVQFPEGIDEVYMYPGFIKHLKKRHPGIFEAYYHLIPEIISNPDYVGQNPKEPRSLEFIKRVGDDLLLAIKFDPSRGYLFLASFYDLDNGENKIKQRLRIGRIVPYKY